MSRGVVAVGGIRDDGLSIAELPSPALLCRRFDGSIIAHNASVTALLRDIDADVTKGPTRVPAALWDALVGQPAGEPLEWWRPGARRGARITRFMASDTTDLVMIVPIERHEDTQAYRLYQATRHVMARMVAGAAHDLRSPLSSMTFNLGVLRRRWAQLSDAEKQLLLAEFAASCEWQLRAVDELVEVATQPDVTDIPLAPLLDRIGERLRPLYRVRRNRLVVEVPAELKVRGVVMTLDHIFLNLLTNAVQSAQDPVTTEVRCAPQVVDGCVCIRVQDDGPGIPAELRSQIFQPFVSTKHDGSGMGLCLAREAARQLGGDILLRESTRGACFEVRLPHCDDGAGSP